jgi:predicted chitinase
MAQNKTDDKFKFVNKDLIDYMRSKGMDDEYIANFLFMAESEGGGRRESLYYTTPERVWGVFNKNAYFKGLSKEQGIEKVIKDGLLRNPEKMGDTFYGGRMGNAEKGDGLKYRGGTIVQGTGKKWYDEVGKRLGVDLVTDPEVLYKKGNEVLALKAAVEHVLINDPKFKIGRTPEGMHRLIGPATPFSESKARSRILTSKEIDDLVIKNTAIARLDEQTKQVKSGYVKTPTLPIEAKDWSVGYAYPVDKIEQTKMGLAILGGTSDFMKDAPKSQRDWMVNKLLFDPFDNSSLETQVEKQLSQRNNNTQLGK